ncbi:MAG: hypothetical protein IJY42_06835, partial [Clostridia bacterium]|nr:hypothetical protein [Clostridia bacterium]
GESARIVLLSVTGSGYCALSHRDFLGALLGRGLERGVMGDLIVADAARPTAYLWLDEEICDFVLNEWKTVGRDHVKVCRAERPPFDQLRRQTVPLRDTVASPRLDGVVAALCSLSRDKAAGMVVGGLVELDYLTEDRGDRTVCAPAVISVRGYGKFKVLSLSEPTKKGRIRLEAEKYV